VQKSHMRLMVKCYGATRIPSGRRTVRSIAEWECIARFVHPVARSEFTQGSDSRPEVPNQCQRV